MPYIVVSTYPRKLHATTIKPNNQRAEILTLRDVTFLNPALKHACRKLNSASDIFCLELRNVGWIILIHYLLGFLAEGLTSVKQIDGRIRG